MANDIRYFTHDHNARHDPKIQALIKKYGMEGYGRFWVIVEMMRETREYKITRKPYVYNALAEQMQCSADEVKKFIKDCIEEYELFTEEGDFFFSNSLNERMSVLEAMRDKKRSAAYIMHTKYGHNLTKEPGD